MIYSFDSNTNKTKNEDFNSELILLPLVNKKQPRALSYSNISSFEIKDILSKIITVNQNHNNNSNFSHYNCDNSQNYQGNQVRGSITSINSNTSSYSSIGDLIYQNMDGEETIKLMMIGDNKVGKTRLIHCFMQNKITNYNYEPTLG